MTFAGHTPTVRLHVAGAGLDDASIANQVWKAIASTTRTATAYDVVRPKKFSDAGPDCLDQNPVPGFKVDVGRIIKQGGEVVKTEKFTTSNRPEEDVTFTNSRR